jgi:hypothetical protein
MEALTNFVKEYPWAPLAVYWGFSAIVDTMPVPLPSERWYGWLYNFMHTIAANLSRVGQKQTQEQKDTAANPGKQVD